MANSFKPKTWVLCPKCRWHGKRYFTKKCPERGYWHPRDVKKAPGQKWADVIIKE